jgi:hypothetical protein
MVLMSERVEKCPGVTLLVFPPLIFVVIAFVYVFHVSPPPPLGNAEGGGGGLYIYVFLGQSER